MTMAFLVINPSNPGKITKSSFANWPKVIASQWFHRSEDLVHHELSNEAAFISMELCWMTSQGTAYFSLHLGPTIKITSCSSHLTFNQIFHHVIFSMCFSLNLPRASLQSCGEHRVLLISQKLPPCLTQCHASYKHLAYL